MVIVGFEPFDLSGILPVKNSVVKLNFPFEKALYFQFGSSGIRTHEAEALHLKCNPFDRSGILPVKKSVLITK